MRFNNSNNISIYHNPKIEKQVTFLFDSFNSLFSNVQKNTSDLYTHKFRTNKITFNDAILFRFLYSSNNKSQDNVASTINDALNYSNINKNKYIDKDKNIPLSVYLYI